MMAAKLRPAATQSTDRSAQPRLNPYQYEEDGDRQGGYQSDQHADGYFFPEAVEVCLFT
jgi:hypothetical protein